MEFLLGLLIGIIASAIAVGVYVYKSTKAEKAKQEKLEDALKDLFKEFEIEELQGTEKPKFTLVTDEDDDDDEPTKH